MSEFVLEGITAEFRHLDRFTQGYIEAVCFAEDCAGEGFRFDELAPETLEKIKADCLRFCDDPACGKLAMEDGKKAGRDFLFTRNGHGCGFWDGDWDDIDPNGLLTSRAKSFGQIDFYRGDDGLIYC